MMRILFVDDEPRVLRGLRRMLQSERARWSMEFVDGGEDALQRLAAEPFDALVTDIRMSPMDGVELLHIVREKYPGLIRIVLSGQCNEDHYRAATESAHHVLGKPCNAGALRQAIEEAAVLRRAVADPDVLAFVGTLEHADELTPAAELSDAVEQPDGPAAFAAVAAAHPRIAARVIEAANCEMLCQSNDTTDLGVACAQLGRANLRALLVALTFFESYAGENAEEAWQHSLRTGALAKRLLGEQGGHHTDVQHAFLGGLLHDCGQVVLDAQFPDRYLEVRRRVAAGTPVCEAERAVLGVDHARLGGHLLSRWRLPEPSVRAVAFHHDPATISAPHVGPLAAVHIADSVIASKSANPGVLTADVDPEYISALGMRRAYEDLLCIVEGERGV